MTFSKEDGQRDSQQVINAVDKGHIENVSQTSIEKISGENIHTGPNYYSYSKQEKLNDYLARAVAVYKGRLYQAVTQVSHPSSPYKLLSSFRIEDASIFCGRTSATEELCKKVVQDRILVIHAKSGAGKTSLLNAGLFPYLIRQGRLPLYIHTYDKDPVLVIKQALVSAALSPWPDELHDLSLHQFLAHVCDCLKRDNIEELVIVLDQFEDFFLCRTQPSERLDFIKALGDCYSDRTLSIRIIISLRKDYYSDLAEFEQVLPYLHIYQNYFWPSVMTRREVKEAIVRPLKELDSNITYDPNLLNTLLDELSCNEVELPLLQIICTRLYETRGKDKKRITSKMYEALGKTEGVLKTYLNEVLDGLPEKDKTLVKDILKEFVRSDLTKQTLSEKKLVARIKCTKNELGRILAQLVDARLLFQNEMEGETRYELVHDYLITEIVKWIDTADREFKRAEELLRSEVANWHSYGHLISLERLELLYPYRERFKGLGVEHWACLLRSVIDAEIDAEIDADTNGPDEEEVDVTNWVKVVHEIDAQLLSKAIVEPLIVELQSYENEKVRSYAAQSLAKIGKYAGIYAAEPLIAALQDEKANVRHNAAKALGELGDIRALEPLIAALQDEKANVRRNAAKALGELGDIRALELLLVALQDMDEYVRADVASALGELGDIRAVEPLLVALQNENWGAATALGKLRDVRAFEPLIVNLKSNNSTLRRWAAWGLGIFGDSRAFEPLIAALQYECSNNEPYIGPVKALGELGDIRAFEPLANVLKYGANFILRCNAAEALGNLGDERSIDCLIDALNDGDYYVCESAEKALGKIKKLKRV